MCEGEGHHRTLPMKWGENGMYAYGGRATTRE